MNSTDGTPTAKFRRSLWLPALLSVVGVALGACTTLPTDGYSSSAYYRNDATYCGYGASCYPSYYRPYAYPYAYPYPYPYYAPYPYPPPTAYYGYGAPYYYHPPKPSHHDHSGSGSGSGSSNASRPPAKPRPAKPPATRSVPGVAGPDAPSKQPVRKVPGASANAKSTRSNTSTRASRNATSRSPGAAPSVATK